MTHWAVDSASAAQITAGAVTRHTSTQITRAQALQQVAVDMIAGKVSPGKGRSDWSHPFYWAPYALVGDGRR